MRSDNAGESWQEISGNLPTDFGFVIDVHAHEPETIFVVPIKSDSEHYSPEEKLRVYRSRTGGNDWEALTKGLTQGDCYVNVLRDAMAVDSLDSCGAYFGTTGGQVYASPDAGDSWALQFSAFRRYLIADRSAQHRIVRFEGVKNRALRNLTLNLELHFATNARQRSQMCREYDFDHGRVWTSTESTAGRSRTMGEEAAIAS
jgi:hypothetical protein